MSNIEGEAPIVAAVPAGNGTIVTLDAAGKTVTADAVTGQPTSKPTGKVLAGGVAGLAGVVVVAALTAITPELLEPIGPWKVVVYAAIVAAAGFVSSYVKRP